MRPSLRAPYTVTSTRYTQKFKTETTTYCHGPQAERPTLIPSTLYWTCTAQI